MTTNTQPQTQQSGGESIEQMLLRVRSDRYGDSGNYNDAKLVAAIEARERAARIDELQRLEFKEATGYLAGANHIIRQQVVTKRLQQLQLKPQAGEGGEV